MANFADASSSCSLLHVLISLRAEGTPRLALELLREEKKQTGKVGHVAFLHTDLRDLEPRFNELNVPLHELPWKRRRFDRLFFQTLRLLKRIKPQGIICYPLGAHVPVSAAAKMLGIPCVVHVGNTPPLHSSRALKILRWQMLAGLPFIRRYVCCSDCVRDAVCTHYSVPRRKTVRVYNGIQLDRFLAVRPVVSGAASTRQSNLRAPASSTVRRSLTIGMVASLEPSKDHATLLRAIAVLKQHHCPVELRLLGAGSLRTQLEEMTSQLQIHNNVKFLGVVDDVPGALAQLDVFAFSATPDEGMGIALVEALAAGLPCVGSNVAACREVLRDGELGMIVARQDPELWADALMTAQDFPAVHQNELLPFDIATTYRQYCESLFGKNV
jgi:glycosyltransferase involved in cell wall biosynthesis